MSTITNKETITATSHNATTTSLISRYQFRNQRWKSETYGVIFRSVAGFPKLFIWWKACEKLVEDQLEEGDTKRWWRFCQYRAVMAKSSRLRGKASQTLCPLFFHLLQGCDLAHVDLLRKYKMDSLQEGEATTYHCWYWDKSSLVQWRHPRGLFHEIMEHSAGAVWYRDLHRRQQNT
jgi:hypothetical protein